MTSADRAALFGLLGLDPALGADRQVRLPAGVREGMLSSRHSELSLLPAHPVRVADLAMLRAVVGDRCGEPADTNLAPWTAEHDPGSHHTLGAADHARVRQALIAAALGTERGLESFAGVMARRFFPMQAALFAARDLTVRSGEVLRIEPDGHDPVVCVFDTVTLQAGGLIQIEAPAIIHVGTLKKTAA
jgi:hypothetical protein